jgi:superoxide dismutase, Fe-Mn family
MNASSRSMASDRQAATPRDDLAYREQEFQFRKFEGGLSPATLATHLELYRGYLAQTNELVGALADPAVRREAGTVTRPREALSRRMSFELNGVKLHEWYFEQLAGQSGARAPDSSSVAAEAMDVGFGGFEGWRADVEALATTRGIGWVVAAWDRGAGQLVNLWADLHQLHLPAGHEIVFVLDLWEHAYWNDFGPKGRGDYSKFVLASTDWQVVEARFARARQED